MFLKFKTDRNFDYLFPINMHIKKSTATAIFALFNLTKLMKLDSINVNDYKSIIIDYEILITSKKLLLT